MIRVRVGMKGRRQLHGLQLSIQFSGWMLIVIVRWSLVVARGRPAAVSPLPAVDERHLPALHHEDAPRVGVGVGVGVGVRVRMFALECQ